MIRYTIRRILWGVSVLLALLVITFVLFGPILQDAKGASVATVICGPRCTPGEVKTTEKYLGLNKPWYQQFGLYVQRLLLGPSHSDYAALCPQVNGQYSNLSQCVGRLGQSFIEQRSVDSIMAETFPVTLSLTIGSAVIWLLLSFVTGVVSAIKRGSLIDRSAMVFVLTGQALPVYYVGLLALYFISYKVGWLPIGGYATFSPSNPWPWIDHMLLPCTVLALQFAALYTRMIRSGMLNVMNEDYVRTARAKGVPPHRVVIRHALRNVLLPIVTMAGLDIGTLLGGAILTEVTFGLPGLGAKSVQAVSDLDVPLASGTILFAGAAIVTANIIVDLVYASLDPRIRLS